MKIPLRLFFALLVFHVFALQAQDSDTASNTGNKSTVWSKIKKNTQFSMSGGFWIGTFTNINVQPQLGYRITDRWTSGIGGHFQYFQSAQFGQDPFYIYGGNVFSRYMLTENLFAQCEIQSLFFDQEWGKYGLLGGGYFPGGGGFYISAYYLFLYPPDRNIYGQPYVIRAGFIF